MYTSVRWKTLCRGRQSFNVTARARVCVSRRHETDKKSVEKRLYSFRYLPKKKKSYSQVVFGIRDLTLSQCRSRTSVLRFGKGQAAKIQNCIRLVVYHAAQPWFQHRFTQCYSTKMAALGVSQVRRCLTWTYELITHRKLTNQQHTFWII